MALPAGILAELRRHVPAVDSRGRLALCLCGWELEADSTDPWLSWVEHLPSATPTGKLVLTLKDLAFLHACRIKVSP